MISNYITCEQREFIKRTIHKRAAKMQKGYDILDKRLRILGVGHETSTDRVKNRRLTN